MVTRNTRGGEFDRLDRRIGLLTTSQSRDITWEVRFILSACDTAPPLELDSAI